MVKLSPNIDRRGRRARLIAGIVLDLCGVALVVAGVSGGRRGMLIGGVVALVFGSFTIFEAANAWCVLRAMGIKTRL